MKQHTHPLSVSLHNTHPLGHYSSQQPTVISLLTIDGGRGERNNAGWRRSLLITSLCMLSLTSCSPLSLSLFRCHSATLRSLPPSPLHHLTLQLVSSRLQTSLCSLLFMSAASLSPAFIRHNASNVRVLSCRYDSRCVIRGPHPLTPPPRPLPSPPLSYLPPQSGAPLGRPIWVVIRGTGTLIHFTTSCVPSPHL